MIWACTAIAIYSALNASIGLANVARTYEVLNVEEYRELMENTGSTKVAALTEVGILPDVDLLQKSHIPWAYYMTWSKEFCIGEDHNYDSELKKIYASDYSVTL